MDLHQNNESVELFAEIRISAFNSEIFHLLFNFSDIKLLSHHLGILAWVTNVNDLDATAPVATTSISNID